MLNIISSGEHSSFSDNEYINLSFRLLFNSLRNKLFSKSYSEYLKENIIFVIKRAAPKITNIIIHVKFTVLVSQVSYFFK